MHKRHRGPPRTSTDGRITPGLAPPTFSALHQPPPQRSGKDRLAPPFTAQAFARLCVRSQALEADNATLRDTLEKVAEQNKALEAQLQGLKHSTERRHQLHTQDSAVREAQLEDQLERQKTALSDLARTAEGFARENMLLKEELGQLRDDREDSSKAHAAMQERLSHLQSTCLALGGPRSNGAVPLLGAAPGAGTSGGSGSAFLEQMSATLLVLSDQPKTVQPIEPSRAKAVAKGLPTDMRLALRELEAVKRERDGLQAKAARLAAQLEKLRADHRELQCSLTAERRAASMAATQLQGQLEAAQRKSAHLASLVQEKNKIVEERDAYVKQLERALLTQKHPRPCKGRKQPEEASAAAPMGSDQAATRVANGATSPAAANTPMSLTRVAAGARHNSSTAIGVPLSTAAGTKSSAGWCSYHLGSAARDTGGRCSSLSLRGQGSAVRQAKQQRPGSSPGRLRLSPAAAESSKGRASTPPLRPLELAAILEALEQEKQQQGVQRQHQQSVWQQQEGQHPGSPCERVHMRGRQPSAAPTNPLFSLQARDGSPNASPWNPRSAYTPAALASQEVMRSSGAVAGEGLTQMSPGCLTSCLTFLHKNSLFQCSPLLPEASQQQSPALERGADGLSQPASRDGLVLAISHGQHHSMAGCSAAVGLLSPGDAGPQREALYSAEGPAVAGAPGGQQAADQAACTGNPCGQPKAKRSLIPQWEGVDKHAALPDAVSGERAAQLPPQQAPVAGSQQAPCHIQQPSAGSPSATHTGIAATSRASGQAAGRGGRPSSLVEPGSTCGSEKLQSLGLEELQELPDQGFLCVADLLEALTPRAAGPVLQSEKGAVCERKQEQQQRQALHDREEGKEQHSSNMCMAAKALPAPSQGGRQPPSVLTNRHTQHRVGVSPAGVTRLQTLKQGRVNRAADQVMHAAQAARRDSYAGAASYQAEMRSRRQTQPSPG